MSDRRGRVAELLEELLYRTRGGALNRVGPAVIEIRRGGMTRGVAARVAAHLGDVRSSIVRRSSG